MESKINDKIIVMYVVERKVIPRNNFKSWYTANEHSVFESSCPNTFFLSYL